MIVGVANSWENLSSDSIELMVKTGLVLADFAIIELFLISLEHYFGLCLSTLKDRLSHVKICIKIETFKNIFFGSKDLRGGCVFGDDDSFTDSRLH